MQIQMYVDANATKDRDNKARFAYVIKGGAIVLAQGSGYYDGGFSCTSAEHIACDIGYRMIKLMSRRLKGKIEKVILYTDSQLFINDSYRRPMFLKTQVHKDGKSEGYIIPIEYRWVSSKENIAHSLIGGINETECCHTL